MYALGSSIDSLISQNYINQPLKDHECTGHVAEIYQSLKEKVGHPPSLVKAMADASIAHNHHFAYGPALSLLYNSLQRCQSDQTPDILEFELILARQVLELLQKFLELLLAFSNFQESCQLKIPPNKIELSVVVL